MKEKKKKKMSPAEEYSQGFKDGRRVGHAEGYELGMTKGYEQALSSVMDYTLGKLEERRDG